MASARPGVQLAAVALPIIVLLTAASIWFAWSGYQRSTATADHEVQLLASAAAVDAQRFLTNRIELLQSVSAAPVLEAGTLTAVHDYLDTVVSISGFSELGFVDTTGYARTVGGAPLLREPLYAGDRPHIQKALQTRQPVIGAAQISQVSQQPTFNVVVPIIREGALEGLLAGGIRLNGPKFTDLRFGAVDGLRVLDGQGNVAVVGEQPDLRELRSATTWPAYARVRSDTAGVLLVPQGVLGERDRVIGFAAVPGTDWLVLVDRSRDALHAPARRALTIEVTIAAAFAAISVVGVAWSSLRLEAAAQRFVRFTEALTHDIGTPLTVIRAYATRLQRALADRPAVLSDVREIDQAGRRIERMVQALADLLGPEGRPALTRDELDLAALVEEIVQEYRHRTGRDIRYTSAAPSLIGEWDRLRVERVVDNLLSNALKYSPVTAPVLVLVGATSSATGRTVTIEVRDYGRGIPRGEEEAVWQRFRRGSNTGEIPGQGVGLASVRQIVQEHGGTVTLRAADGQGTVATVRLPWPEDDAPDPDDPDDPDEAAGPAGA